MSRTTNLDRVLTAACLAVESEGCAVEVDKVNELRDAAIDDITAAVMAARSDERKRDYTFFVDGLKAASAMERLNASKVEPYSPARDRAMDRAHGYERAIDLLDAMVAKRDEVATS